MRSLIPRGLAAVTAAAALWVACGALAVAAPGQSRIGLLPPWWIAALAAVVSAGAAAALRANGWLALFGLALLILPWLPGPVPAPFLVWTGPLVFLAGGAVLLAAGFHAIRRGAGAWPGLTDPRRAPVVAACLSLVLYGAAAWRAAPLIPGGDEPHYLVITQSLLYDFDLQIENNHTRGDYRAYSAMDLRPDYIVRGANGAIYSIHMPGLSVLVGPAFLVAGHPGAAAFIVLLAACAGALLWRLAFTITGQAGAAWFGWAAVTLSVPMVFHGFTIYPDSAAVLPVLVGVHALLRAGEDDTSGHVRRWLTYGAVLATLPWLHSRLALIAGVFGALVLTRLARRPHALRKAAAFLLVPIVSAVGWFGFFQIVYGSPNPRVQYGGLLDAISSPWFITSGIGGLLFDQQFGVVPHAPVLACGAGGVLLMLLGRGAAARLAPVSHRRLAMEILLLVIPYVVSTTTMRMWWGGWSAPGRFLVPLLPLLGLGAAVAWQRAQNRATRATLLGAAAISAAMSVTFVWVDRGRLAYNVRQTDALWLEWAGPLADLARGLPTFLRSPEPDAWLQTIVWAVALLTGWLVARAAARVAASRAAVALVLVAAYSTAGMIALAIVWRLNGSLGIQPTVAQLELLRAAAARGGFGVAFEPMTRIRLEDIPARLTIVPGQRYGPGRNGQLMALPGPIPAGTYAVSPVSTALALAGSSLQAPRRVGQLSAGIGREFVPVWQASLAPQSPDLTLDFPVDVRTLVVRGDEASLGWVHFLSVHPREIVAADRRPTENVARHAVRYGQTVVYFMDEGAFPEREAFWIRGGQSAGVVLDSQSPRSSAPVFVRNAPVENTLRIEAGRWREELRLNPGEERHLSIPLDSQHEASLVRFGSASGFRPSEVEPSSSDHRFLGVWIRME